MQADPEGPSDFLVAPAGAMRILARRGDSQVLIVHGEDRVLDIEAGERLAWVEWLPSVEVASTMSEFCSRQLVRAHFTPDLDGWHSYAVVHLKALIHLGRNHLNVTFHPATAPVMRERQAWTGERIARLAFLAGKGWTAKAIAADPLIRSTANNVFRQAHRFGIVLSDKVQGQVHIRLPADTLQAFECAATRHELTRDALIRRVLIQAGAAPERLAAA